MTEKEKEKIDKTIQSFRNFIKSKENEQDKLCENEEFYKDDIEQNEMFLKMLHFVLNLIQKQQEEIKKKDKQIDLMAETILEDTEKLDTYWCNGCFKTAECSYKNPNECIKQYFEKQAKEV